ncbi:TonB-dependent receptor [Hyalangium gracile]|uniref:TonB-dependent receptor n=1 Tax=Hyalangium gracile TaxID=394092 RepID=UPI001CCC205B|nr:TonB-dependent receptor [Hyalangium gracile]
MHFISLLSVLLLQQPPDAPQVPAESPAVSTESESAPPQAPADSPPPPEPAPQAQESAPPSQAPSANLEPDEQPSAQTVVTATRVAQPADEAPRAVTVVDREELARRPARTTPEALAEQEGVFLQKTNHGGGAPIIRGLYGQHILLLVDGVRLNNATVRSGPNQYLNTVDPFLIDQIEVVRGPGSVLYGSDALGGVINVRTFWPRFTSELTPIGQLRAQAGTADMSLQGHLRAGLSLENTAVAAGVTLRDFNDLRGGERVGLQRYTGYQEGDASLKLRHRLAPSLQLAFQYQGVRQSDAPRLDRSAPGDFRRFTEQQRDFLHGRLEHTSDGLLRRWAVELSSHRQNEQVDRFRVSRDRIERDAATVWTVGMRIEAETSPLESLPLRPQLVMGLDLFRDRVTSLAGRSPLAGAESFSPRTADARYPGAPTSISTGVFGLLTSDAREPFSWHLGGRVQFNSTHLPEDARLAELFASAPTPPPVLPEDTLNAVGVAAELGAQYRLARGLSLLANLGSGFRAPNIDDYLRLGAEGPGFLVPGRALRTEQSYTAELGVRAHRERLSAEFFYAYTLVSGLVGNVPTALDGATENPDGLPYLARQNRDRAQLHALEAAVAFQVLPRLSLATHATWTYTQQRRKDLTLPGEPLILEPLSRTPPLNGLVRATYTPLDSLFFEAVARWATAQRELSAADRLDVRTCAEVPDCNGTPGFVAFHLRGGVQWGPRLRVSGTLQNLLNATYRTHGSGVEEAGRSFVLAVEAAL